MKFRQSNFKRGLLMKIMYDELKYEEDGENKTHKDVYEKILILLKLHKF